MSKVQLHSLCRDIGCSSHEAALLYANQLGILDPLCSSPESVTEAYEEDQDRLESATLHTCILHEQARCDEAAHIVKALLFIQVPLATSCPGPGAMLLWAWPFSDNAH